MGLKIRRLVATYIDALIVAYVSIKGCYLLSVIIESFVENDKLFFILQAFLAMIGILLIINLFLRKDMIFGYESIGKKLMRLKIYQGNERVLDKKILIDRVLHSMWPFNLYPFMILYNNQSSGDKKMGTEVK